LLEKIDSKELLHKRIVLRLLERKIFAMKGE